MPDDETLRHLEELANNVLEEALAVAFYLKAKQAQEERGPNGEDRGRAG